MTGGVGSRLALPVAWLAVGAAWLPTLSPGVRMDNDVGALQAVCATFGVAHPTGFPLYTLACGAFVHAVPVGELAWRANLFSAVCGLAAVGALFAVLRRIGAGPWLAAAGAAGFAALPVAWRVAAAAEVYHLHLLLAGLAWAGVLAWRVGAGERWLWAAVGAACLGVGVHPMMALTAPGLLVAVVLADRRAALRAVPVGVLALGVALLPHVWLWSRAHDPTTPLRYMQGGDLAVYIAYATGAQFRAEMLGLPDLAVLWREAGLQTLLAAAAVPLLWRVPDRAVRLGLLVAAVVHGGFALTYGIGEVGPYVLPVAWLGVVGAVAAVGQWRRVAWVAGPAVLVLLVVNRGAARHPGAVDEAATADRVSAAVGPDGVVVVRHWSWVGAMWAQQLATRRGGPAVVGWETGRGPLDRDGLAALLDGESDRPHRPEPLPADPVVHLVGPGWADAQVACTAVVAGVCRVERVSSNDGLPGRR